MTAGSATPSLTFRWLSSRQPTPKTAKAPPKRGFDLVLLLVGDTGFEPVTSSVSTKDHLTLTYAGTCSDLEEWSVGVRLRPPLFGPAVTQLVTQLHANSTDHAMRS